MKQRKIRRAHPVNVYPLYPNAASPQYFLGKLVDILTAAASGIGFLAVLIFQFLL